MAQLRPVIFLAFANDREGEVGYLRNLPEELRQIRTALDAGRAAGTWDLLERPNATLPEILDAFQHPDYRDRIAVFHFGGHASSFELLFEARDGRPAPADAAGLANFLGHQRALQFLFLNGCSTEAQAEGLLQGNVSAVIATSRSIQDSVATDFAVRFYRGLAGGAGVQVAFDEAAAAVRAAGGGVTRDFRRADAVTDDGSPWRIHFRPGAAPSVGSWGLGAASGDPLFGLPPVPPRDLPESPYRHLQWFSREHAEVFFGRGEEIRKLYDRVIGADGDPILLLYGQSGVGKSSLLDAGLRPRLEATHEIRYLRRDPNLELLGTLRQALDAGSPAGKLPEAWHALEARTGRPLLVILDQVEEAFTRGGGKGAAELTALAAGLVEIFGLPATRPRGRLLLGFRKEWLAEVERALAEERLPRSKVFVGRLGREGIVEAITGPARVGRLRDRYGLTVEDELPETIADDLLADPDAHIAPTLQILLTKMWREATAKDASHPCFDRDLYLTLVRRGLLLKDFLDEQLEELDRRWDARGAKVDTGLSLDLLAFHTTALGTAERRTASEVAEAYGHVAGTVGTMVLDFQDLFLLVDDSADRAERLSVTRLAHDTLAPLVRREFDDSALPGQLARRIIENRAVTWRNGQTGEPLDGPDLARIEAGAPGMRAWTADEKRLVEASRRALADNLRRRRASRLGAVAALVVILSLVGWGWFQWLQGRTAKREAESRLLASRSLRHPPGDSVGAIVLAIAAAETAETYEAEAALRSVVDTNRPHAVLAPEQKRDVTTASFSPDGEHVVSAGYDRRAHLWNRATAHEEASFGQEFRAIITHLEVSPDGHYLLASSADGTARIWSLGPPQQQEPVVRVRHRLGITTARFSPDGRRIVTASLDGTAQVWDAETGAPVATLFAEDAPTVRDASFSPDGRRVVIGCDDGSAAIWTVEPAALQARLRGHTQAVVAVGFTGDGRWVVTASKDGTARVWTPEGRQVAGVPHHGGVVHLAFSRDGNRVATASEGPAIQVWAVPSGQLLTGIHPLMPANHVAFSPDGTRLASTGVDGSVRIWSTQTGQETAVLRGHTGTVNSVEFSPSDGRWVVTAGADGTARIFAVRVDDLKRLAEARLPRGLSAEARRLMVER